MGSLGGTPSSSYISAMAQQGFLATAPKEVGELLPGRGAAVREGQRVLTRSQPGRWKQAE